MIQQNLIHSIHFYLKHFFVDGSTYWYDNDCLWNFFKNKFKASNEVTESSVVFCSKKETYEETRESGAKCFISLAPIEDLLPGHQLFPIHLGIWAIHKPLSTLPLKFLKLPAAFKNLLCFNATKSGPFVLARCSQGKWGPSDIVLFMYDDPEKWRIVFKGEMNKRVLEDPRSFFHSGVIYSAYTAIHQYITGFPTRSSLGYAPIMKPNLLVPQFGKNLEKGPEKNWGFFSLNNSLYAIYSYSPWKILKIDNEEAEVFYEQEFPAKQLGLIHGGACPVLHDGKMWAFGRCRDSPNIGSILCVVFDPANFQVLAWGLPQFLHNSVFENYLFYIGSAEIQDGMWKCIGGFNDAAIVEISFPHEKLLKELLWI